MKNQVICYNYKPVNHIGLVRAAKYTSEFRTVVYCKTCSMIISFKRNSDGECSKCKKKAPSRQRKKYERKLADLETLEKNRENSDGA